MKKNILLLGVCVLMAGVVHEASAQSPDLANESRDLSRVVRHPDGTMAPESVSPEEYGAFLSAVFDEWIACDLGRTDVQLFAEMAGILSGKPANLCSLAPTCGRAVVVEEDGSVYSCDHFVSPEYKLGNIRQDGLRNLVDGPIQKAFGEHKRSSLTSECRACPYLPLCGGGCPKDRFSASADGEAGQYYLCLGLKAFFAHAVPRLKEVMRLSRLGKSPGEIMEKLK